MIKLLEKKTNSSIIVIIIFIVLFLLGLKYLPNIGSNFDEQTEENILRSNVMQYAQASNLNSLVNYYSEMGISPISESIEKDHGISAYYIFSPVLLLKYISKHYLSVLWHLYTYLLFFLGVIYIYRLAKYLFNNKKVALATTLMYFISPRILIDGLHNNKDIVLMSLLIVMIFYGIKIIRERKYKHAIIFGLFSGLVCNIKIIGLFFSFMIGMGYIISIIRERKINKHTIICGFIALTFSLICFLALTPAIWGNGHFDLIEYIRYCLSNSVSFRAGPKVWFEGTQYNSLINPLPWYYIPKYIIITLPIVTIVLFLVSTLLILIDFIKSIKKKTWNNDLLIMIIVYIMFAVPLCIAIITRPNVYNGWRHFYFLYGLICIVNIYSINYLMLNKNKIVQLFTYITISLSFIFNSYCILKYGIANTAYYNLLISHTNIEDKYELDYYGVTSIDSFNKFLKQNLEYNKNGKIYLYGDKVFNARVIMDSYNNSSSKIKNTIEVVTEDNLYKILSKNEPVYAVCNSVYTNQDMSNYELIYSYKIFDSHITNFYKIDKNYKKVIIKPDVFK